VLERPAQPLDRIAPAGELRVHALQELLVHRAILASEARRVAVRGGPAHKSLSISAIFFK
jgi:hypothetical protein